MNVQHRTATNNDFRGKKIVLTGKFKQDKKRCYKRGLPIDELDKVIGLLEHGTNLPEEYKAHILKGDYRGQWECHIQPNWLLIWKVNGNTITLLDTGTHAELFSK